MLSKFEKDVLTNLSIDTTWEHVEYLSTLDKTSGTEGERKAHEFIRKKLMEYRVPFETYEFDSLISHPKDASLEIVIPNVFELECITHSFSASTPENGIEAELIFVPIQSGTPYTREWSSIEGLVETYRKIGVEGKVALIWGLARPPVVWAAQQAGALGQVHISGEDILHEMIVTTIWGTPTPKSAKRIPKISAISIKKSDGERLHRLLKEHKVRVRICSKADNKWMRIPITVAEITGKEEPENFMLVHGHMDSWYGGATDNSTGNAACLELARLLWKYRGKLKRSIRLAWWPGHSTGRYSGSTWYADNFFGDLNKNCFLTMNIDSPGVQGATRIDGYGLMGTKKFMTKVIKDATGLKVASIRQYAMRAGDQSFYGIGIPSVATRLSIPEGSPLRGRWIGGSGGGWWWHSAHDTLDKCDKKRLLQDLKLEVLTILRAVNCRILPFNFELVAEEYEKTIRDLQAKVNSKLFDLDPIYRKIRKLKSRSETLNRYLDDMEDTTDTRNSKKINRLLLKTSRILTSTLYTYTGIYDQDPAYYMGLLPTLQQVTALANMNKESGKAKYLKTKMIRQRNKGVHHLEMALELIDEILYIAQK